MKQFDILFCENLNLITMRNIQNSLEKITDFLDCNSIELITCNVKPSGLTDVIIESSDSCISRIISAFKNEVTSNNSITIRSGVCRLTILSSLPSITIAKITSQYFESQEICIERITTSVNETQIFFPALEVCGCLKTFITNFETYLNLNLKKEPC